LMFVVVVGLGIWWLRGHGMGKRVVTSMREHVVEWTLGIFGTVYLGIAVGGNLNLGIRHILPVYMPIFV
jgi:hypothetical protein